VASKEQNTDAFPFSKHVPSVVDLWECRVIPINVGIKRDRLFVGLARYLGGISILSMREIQHLVLEVVLHYYIIATHAGAIDAM